MKRNILLSIAIFFSAILAVAAEITRDERHYLDFLYSIMNPADKADRSEQFYLDNAVRPALRARKEMPWGESVSERDFKHFVLPLRVNNEAIDPHRPAFYNELRDRVKGMSMADAILEINHWCHEKVTYQPSDGRTHSPLQSVSSAIGRCGEESTFTVAALRSMGIPARQVYTPRWAHTDDNHAWVEAWADGKWYFLGACEPEPVLNLGWFNAPASRGMLMHARVPGKDYDGPEEVLGRAEGNTDINVTSNYAPVDTISVTIVDRNGNPVKDANVTFRVYNYAEFYPVASKLTDSKGEASLVTGLGDLLVWATDGQLFGMKKLRVGTDRNAIIRLDHDRSASISMDLDIVPPAPGKSTVEVSEQQRFNNNQRAAHEDSIRNTYTASFFSSSDPRIIASSQFIDSTACQILKASRGNYHTIEKFLFSAKDRTKAIKLLQSLTEKDLTDVTESVLKDHYAAIDTKSPLFAQYVMSPRIANEELTEFRSTFLNHFSPKQVEAFRKKPVSWVKYVADSIDCSLSWYPAQATMSPAAVLKTKSTSTLSRDIFFVAGARSFGIPARINPINGKTQWADKSGKWNDAAFETTDDSPEINKSALKLSFNATKIVDDPKYYTHFTISSIEKGEPQLLTYPDFQPLSENFAKGEFLDDGQYMIVTGQRLADGSVLAHIDIFPMEQQDRDLPLTLREDSNAIQVMGNFDAETKFMPLDAPDECSILSTTGRGYYVLALVEPNNEPSNHFLRDIAAESTALESLSCPIILLYESKDAINRIEQGLLPNMPNTTTIGIDTDKKILKQLVENLRLDSSQQPTVIIADTFNRVVFISQGYSIGLGRTIADIFRQL